MQRIAYQTPGVDFGIHTSSGPGQPVPILIAGYRSNELLQGAVGGPTPQHRPELEEQLNEVES